MKRISKILAITLAASMMLAGCGTKVEEVPAQTTETVEESVAEETAVEEVVEETSEETESEEASTEEVAEEIAETEEVADASMVVSPVPAYLDNLPETGSVEFASRLKLGWNLGNTLDATASSGMDSETSWGQPKATKELMDYLFECGFTTIRIPVSWGKHTDSDYQIDPEWMARVTEVVDWALDSGLYVVINSHHDNDYYYPSEENMDNAKKYLSTIWTQIADNFKDYDERLIFESMNEPRLSGTDIEWWFNTNDKEGCAAIERIAELDQLFIDTIRAGESFNTSRYLMVSSYAASPDFTMHRCFTLPTDPKERMMLSIHAYTPYDFAMNPNGYDEWAPGSHSGELTFISKLNNTYVLQDIGVFISEFGVTNKDNIDSRCAWAADYTSKAAQYGIGCCIWDNGGTNVGEENFGLIDRTGLQVYFPELLDAYLSGYYK